MAVGWDALQAAANDRDVERMQALLEGGADPNTRSSNGVSVLNWVANSYRSSEQEKNEALVKMVELLLDKGAAVDSRAWRGATPLHLAAERGHEAIVSILLDRGADVNAVDDKGALPLHRAASAGHVATMALLLDRGAKIDALTTKGSSAIQAAGVETKHPDVIALLLERGASVNPFRKNEASMLNWAARFGFRNVAEVLLQRGVDVNSTSGYDKESALHGAVQSGKAEMARWLLDIGANVNAKTQSGVSVLHWDVGQKDILSLLLARSVDVTVTDKDNFNALDWIYRYRCGRLEDETLAFARTLCSCGLTFNNVSAISPALNEDEQLARLGFSACVTYWHDCYELGEALTEVPSEVVKTGEGAVKTYLGQLQSTTPEDRIYRRKLCVVGSSTSGKTSLIKSITTGEPFLVKDVDRTIGIDLFPFTFIERTQKAEDAKRHDVTCWDFAGQDIYQVAHALFFSKRTLFVVCIDGGAYEAKLNEASGLTPLEAEHMLQTYLEDSVLRWVRVVLARQPKAQFAVIGTKSDLVRDAKTMLVDLKIRMSSFVNAIAVENELDASTTNSLRRDLIACTLTSVTTIEGVAKAREVIESAVQASAGLSFMMPKMYTQVLECIQTIKQEASINSSPEDRIRSLVVPFTAFCTHLFHNIPSLEADECRDILRTFDALGDVLWYEQEVAAFKDVIILDPGLMLDIVREVVNHHFENHVGVAYDSLRRDGTLQHSLLLTFPAWKALNEVDSELVHLFKHLLQFFELAYPTGSIEMHTEVDLIVPTYWRFTASRELSDTSSFSRQSSTLPPQQFPTGTVVGWQYKLPVRIAESVYTRFVVRSYRSMTPRTITENGFQSTVEGGFAAVVSFFRATRSWDVVRFEVAVPSELLAWEELRFFIMAMEQVLATYTGIRGVHRQILQVEPGDVVRAYSVSEAVHLLQEAAATGREESFVREKMPWVPPAFSWYLEAAWTDPSKLQEIKTRDVIGQLQHKVSVVQKLVVAGDRQRRLPALWTLQYAQDTSRIDLRMLSDVSGACFHLPIEIDLPPEFVRNNADWLQHRVSILSVVSSALISIDIVKTALGFVTGASSDVLHRSVHVHNMIDGLELSPGDTVSSSSSKLSPSGTMSLLRELLLLHDGAFDELRVCELANLRCAATKFNGSYVWAHEQEIVAMHEHLIPCDPASLPSPAQSRHNSGSKNSLRAATLRVCGAVGLESRDWHKPYCEWRLEHDTNGAVQAEGRTEQACDTKSDPVWKSGTGVFKQIESMELLRACKLLIAVKRPHRLSAVLMMKREPKTVGHGEVRLADHLPADHNSTDPIEIKISLGASANAFVSCELTFEPPATGA